MSKITYDAKKKYGQNFLDDNNLLLDIINIASLDNTLTEVIEIGPGLGFLTEELIKNSKKVIM